MKMSTIDQRPTCSMIRYIRLRSRSRHLERRCTVIRRKIKADQLQHRHGGAGEEHQERHRPHAGADQRLDPRENGLRLAAAEMDDGHHRQQVGGHVQDGRGHDQRPGAGDAVGLAPVHGGAAARTVRRGPRGQRRHQSQLVAVVTADQGAPAPAAELPGRGLLPETAPDLVRLERRLRGDHHDDQADEREQRDAQLEAGEDPTA